MSGPQQPRSSLAGTAEIGREPMRENALKACRLAWHRDGTICVRAEWFQSWADREQAKLLAEKLFGKRGAQK